MNIQVPCFIINYDECTDREVVNKAKTFSTLSVKTNNYMKENTNKFDGIDIELFR